MNKIPNDPYLLFSFVNTMLRDSYASLDEFCAAYDADRDSIEAKLRTAGFTYDDQSNQFR